MIKNIIKKILNFFSYEIKKIHNINVLDFDTSRSNSFEKYYNMCSSESLNISKERFLSLYQAVRYIYRNKIEGDFVECGVFMGGSAMMIANTMREIDEKNYFKKKVWLYDTFDGMPDADENDVNIDNQIASDFLKNSTKKENSKDIWAYSSLDYVKKNLKKTKLEDENIIIVKGLVEETLEKNKPSKISLLRLDTDFYQSTKIELDMLYPNLVVGGVIIIDDYGHWKGCKKAVDEYFNNKNNFFLQQIDYSGIIGIKTGE